MLKNKTALTFFIFAACFLFPLLTGAVNTDTIGILPAYPDPNVQFSNSWFIYGLDLGQSKRDAVRVINNKNETVVVKIYAVDASTTSDGSFALLTEDAPRTDVGSWVRLAANEIEIPARSEKLVPFIINIPPNADVGDHMGGIIMQEVEVEGDKLTGTGVKIITRVGVRIYETVPGEVRRDFDITRLDWKLVPAGQKNFLKDFLDINKKTFFFVGIKNKGNVKITPKVTLEVKDMLGRTVAYLPDQEVGVVFPGEENSESTVRWDKMPVVGRYKVKATVSFFEQGIDQKSKELVIWAIPYRIIFLIVLLVVVFILGRLIIKYFRESSKEKMPIYKIKEGDTLAKLADKFLVSWKKIAVVNEIRKPFEIRAGERLFIPVNKKNRQIIIQELNSSRLEPSIAERAGVRKKNRGKVILVTIILLLTMASILYWLEVKNKRKTIHQKFQVPVSDEKLEEETEHRTKSGAFKKSSVRVGVYTPSNADSESSKRLIKKFGLVGYKVSPESQLTSKAAYFVTTIEYNSGKLEQAEMVKNDLGVSDRVDLKEIPNLGKDIVIYNLINKDEFLDF